MKQQVQPGDIVVIKSYEEAFNKLTTVEAMLLGNWEEHYFLVDEVFEDLVTGQAITGTLMGSYGEPDLTLIKKVYREVTN
jgi:hypothetical protein